MMLNERLDFLTDYPFQRLRNLLANVVSPDNIAPVDLTIGEPQHAPPIWINDILSRQANTWNKYPPLLGTTGLRCAIAEWLEQRYDLAKGFLDKDTQILPLAGTREGLYMVSQLVVPTKLNIKNRHQKTEKPIVLVPNPFYQVYSAGAIMAGAEVHFLPATAETGFLPNLAAIAPDVLSRTALMFLCSPVNPQGAVADLEYLQRAVELAYAYDFVLAVDECYADIYQNQAPSGILQVCAQLGRGLSHILAFHSLSKRSNAAGLRSGFVVGGSSLIASFARLRSYGGATLPLPIQAVSEALWRDKAHVEENRTYYCKKFDIVERLLGPRFGYSRPAGGFFLWLNVGDGEKIARTLWEKAALRVLPGAYLAHCSADGINPGQPYIRAAIVHQRQIIEDAMSRITKIL